MTTPHITDWPKQTVEWANGQQVYLSVPFTWGLPRAYQRAVWLRETGYQVHAGGPAVALMPNYLESVAKVGDAYPDAVKRHNPLATFTSRGCIYHCPHCPVPRIEGDLQELEDWPIRPIVCDNNLLACSRAHFDRVIDRLKPLHHHHIDFNQGLDARHLTNHHAQRLAELNCTIRLAFDFIDRELNLMTALERLYRAGIPKYRIRVYVLVGFRDTPQDALYRLRTVRQLGLTPNPQRYNPLDTLARDSFVSPGWTDRELTRHVRYFANLRYFGAVPFEEFRSTRGAIPLGHFGKNIFKNPTRQIHLDFEIKPPLDIDEVP